MSEMEIISFELWGMKLQEPMALVTNWMIASFCLYAFFRLKPTGEEARWWGRFFFWMAISTFLGGLSHLFFKYFDKPGKFPNWTTGIACGYFAGRAMIYRIRSLRIKKILHGVLIFKGIALLFLALFLSNFVFIAVDAIVTYLVFCGVIGFSLYKKGFDEFKYMVLGVIVCLPSAFIFLLKINSHRWLNKDDLSHLLMLACIMCFYQGAKRIGKKDSELVPVEGLA